LVSLMNPNPLDSLKNFTVPLLIKIVFKLMPQDTLYYWNVNYF